MANLKSSKHVFLPVVAALCVISGACYSPPFRETEMVPLPHADPELTAAAFAERIPSQFVAENTIIFRFFRREFAALGYARVDREKETFDVLCMNHMGIQLFHISGDSQGARLVQAMPEFREHPGFADAVGNDIRRIYFDLVPDACAVSEVRRDRISFTQTRDGKRVEHVFGGEDKVLLFKRARTGWRRKWDIAFYEYFSVPQPGSSTYKFPRGIVLHNRRHRYRLIVRTRSVDL